VGFDFRGVLDLASGTAHLFEEGKGDRRVPFTSSSLDELGAKGVSDALLQQLRDEAELVSAAGTKFDRELFLGGALTPVYFGSALTNYGVEHFLDGFLEFCPTPVARKARDGSSVNPAGATFSGFAFKIQANLDPRHRDRIAFVRICSGRFERDMEVLHPRTGKKLRLSRAHRLFGQERETVEEAYAGDIVGFINPGEFYLGDTICVGEPFEFEALPQFSPEHFAILDCKETLRRKQFERGIQQLLEEGAIQSFHDPGAGRKDTILGAVGQLQFDVVRYRLESEYNAATDITFLPYELARWVRHSPAELKAVRLPQAAKVVVDQLGKTAVLFRSEWDFQWVAREHPELEFSPVRL
ncbi:MAG: peptide chain release factor 3, partial [Bdellovibrionales bacterium]|nr:peptide chain release factor 3 [Bdellovibrionales bacterium]